MERSDDPKRVNRGKGNRAVNLLYCSATIRNMDSIYPGSGYGRLQEPLLLALRQILVVDQATQYVIYGGSRFRWELCAGFYSFTCRGGFSSTDRLSNISPEMAEPNLPLH